MRVVTLNANGIRSAARKGFFDWLPAQKADVVCIQETKAQVHQLTDPVFWPQGYHCYYFDAQVKGYSGTALYARREPLRVERGFGVAEFDAEGRYLEAEFDRLTVISLYLPSGSAGPARQASKFRFLEAFRPHLGKLARRRKPAILCGDFNIAHQPIDLRNWRANQKTSGFLPEERAWLDEVFGGRYVDAFRVVNGEPDQYTWWSNRGQARAKNVGWRIDYHVASKALRDHVRGVSIYKERWFSDHAPLTIDYDLEP
ncbi:MAG: exodeoxyribonuclease III [Gammaproteobacteria bacterium]|nr:exodeoxyribonuclease III [Gammaproteobacteria bacterium]